MAQTMLPASRSRGVQLRSLSTVMRLMKTIKQTESSGCFCWRVAPKPSALAWRRKGRELSVTASQSG